MQGTTDNLNNSNINPDRHRTPVNKKRRSLLRLINEVEKEELYMDRKLYLFIKEYGTSADLAEYNKLQQEGNTLGITQLIIRIRNNAGLND